jgi:sec-independent protein translocase protein TatC
MAYTDQFNDDGEDKKEMSFLEHLDELRKYIFRTVIAVGIGFLIALVNQDFIFDTIIFGPTHPDFLTYQWLCKLAAKFPALGALCFEMKEFKLIATDMDSQFMRYMSGSLIAGAILAFPYIIYQLWQFVKPALKMKEIKAVRGMTFIITFLFFTGVLFGYFLIAPFSIAFFANFKLSPQIENYFNIESYISILTMLTLATGLVFQFPVLCFFLAKVGILTSQFLRKYRRHSVVVISVIAAAITYDVISLLLMMIPLWGLYEISIFVVRRAEKNNKE